MIVMGEDPLRSHLSLFLFLFFFVVMNLTAQQPVTVKLWPSGAPGTQTIKGPETVPDVPEDNRGHITRVTNVSDPTITVYRPTAGKANGAAVLVFPGGAYVRLAMDIEGTEVCKWFNGIGVTCVVVKYRVPQPNDDTRWKQPLQDAQRAMGVVRQHAKQWEVDAKRIGVIGFSAGAHLSAALSNNYQSRSYPEVDAADKESCRPDFAILLYPGYLWRGSADHSVGEEVKPTANTPPTFLAQTEDDFAHVENSLFYFLALKNAKVPAEMHLYAEGGHGYGMRGDKVPVAGAWPPLAKAWLERIKILQ